LDNQKHKRKRKEGKGEERRRKRKWGEEEKYKEGRERGKGDKRKNKDKKKSREKARKGKKRKEKEKKLGRAKNFSAASNKSLLFLLSNLYSETFDFLASNIPKTESFRGLRPWTPAGALPLDPTTGPKTKDRYWSCYQWRASAKVDN
jgi:hypothetical protein